MDNNINLSKIILKKIYAVNVIMLKGKQTYVRKNRPNYAFSLKLKVDPSPVVPKRSIPSVLFAK